MISSGSEWSDICGGVYAHTWTSDTINIWHFARKNVPKDISSGTPDPLKWPVPTGAFSVVEDKGCDFSNHFRDHVLTIDTTIGGDWAGSEGSLTAAHCPTNIEDIVEDPRNFDSARWNINYIHLASTLPLCPHLKTEAMATELSQQYAFRAQKSIGLVGGSPDYIVAPNFEVPDVPARIYHYSADGRLYAYALPTVVRIFQAEGAQLLLDLPIPNVVDLKFSPRGTYLSTWERPLKLEDGSQHKNLRVFSSSTGEELIGFTQKGQDGWDLQYTISESHAIRLVGPEIQVFRPSEWSKGVVDKLKVEGATSVSLSPGLNPSVAVFVAEKKGQPASIRIYGLLSLNSPPTCQKTFFKADRSQIKWNDLGTQVLLLTQTEVDNSNKSYYGETGLYLLSAAGNFDCRVTLDKEGPIHDFAWSPTSKEFGVVYGFMPAKTMLFDQRVRTIYDFGSSPHNFISFNPQGRLVALAGFGNLAGKMDIFDRRTLTKVCTIDAPNTSYCDWSPDGRFLMTATLSPRLRVDNGIKIYHCSGGLMHVQLVEELYQASWRPTPVDKVAPFAAQLPAAPAPSASVREFAAIAKPVPTRPAGAYRPPGARGLATPAIFKREDEGGAARVPTSGTATPPRMYNRSPAPGSGPQNSGGYQNGGGGYGAQNGGRRHKNRKRKGKKDGEEGQGGNQNQNQGGNQKQRKERGDRERGTPNGEQGEDAGRPSIEVTPVNGEAAPNGTGKLHNGNANGTLYIPPPDLAVDGESPLTSGLDSALDPVAKKARNLNKKLKAIEELKEKAKRGERLEATQLKKMEGEAEIRKELASLGV
ncbi:Eukaryotic translation initiation factor 2A [Mycena venus]|uniref:Eukaryotic translation initiation factor 2A n=1 Tax=Mycena venus TaxID=2733690 RepID=A0A8H6Y742_9AGAR|nr:Eukaryotic translation initiation factor 2A [Mycena venus]